MISKGINDASTIAFLLSMCMHDVKKLTIDPFWKHETKRFLSKWGSTKYCVLTDVVLCVIY